MGVLTLNRATGEITDDGASSTTVYLQSSATRWKSGARYKDPNPMFDLTVSAGTLYLRPLAAPEEWSIDALGVNVTAAAAGSTLVLAVYAQGANGYPSGSYLAAITVSSATTGYKEGTFVAAAGTGPIVVGLLALGGNPTVTCVFNGGGVGIVGTPPTGDHDAYLQTGLSALPAPVAITATAGFPAPLVFVRSATDTAQTTAVAGAITSTATVTFTGSGNAQKFSVTVAGVTTSATIVAAPSATMPGNLSPDEHEMDSFIVAARCVVDGTVELFCRPTGPIRGQRNITIIAI